MSEILILIYGALFISVLVVIALILGGKYIYKRFIKNRLIF